jgi:hypothetical protein
MVSQVAFLTLANMNACGLCGENKLLRKSHIIPKFVFDWIKETGAGALRAGSNMNIRVQDGPKVSFLCDDCEQLFSKSERYAANIFKAVVNNTNSFAYTSELRYFAFSILWRLLKTDVLINEKGCPFYELLQNVECEWRDYLQNGKPLVNFEQLHLFIAVDPLRDGDLEKHNIKVPDKFIQYMGRMTDGGFADGDEKCMMYFKLPRMIFIAPIKGFNRNLYHNTELKTDGGVFYINDCFIADETIGHFLLERAKLIANKFDEISSIQKEALRSRSMERLKEIEEKDLGKILKYNRRRNNDNS